MAFKFELVSPEKLLFSGAVESVTAPGIEGEFTVLQDHAPFMTTLKPGKVVIVGGGKDEEMFVKGGFADVSPEGFTILADYAMLMGEIGKEKFDEDVAAAEKAAEEAIGDETKRLALEHRDQLREFQASVGK